MDEATDVLCVSAHVAVRRLRPLRLCVCVGNSRPGGGVAHRTGDVRARVVCHREYLKPYTRSHTSSPPFVTTYA